MNVPTRKFGVLTATVFACLLCAAPLLLLAESAPVTTGPLAPIVVGEPERIEVSPAKFRLLGVREKLQLVVTGFYADGKLQDLTRVAEFSVGDDKILSVEAAVVLPRGDGEATVNVRVGGHEAVAEVEVVGQSEPQPVSFRNGTLAALSKQGCNAGPCHGSPTGKGGFRMSLRAFDAKLDEYTLLREEYGRRTNPLDPASSLLLMKPLMKVAHGGGLKLSTQDPAYSILHDWIAEGCHSDIDTAPRCVRIEIVPGENRTLIQPAHTQQLGVLAHYSDGSVRDITELAVYSTSDTEVATVTEGGLVVAQDRGGIAVIVRYLEFIESTIITFVREIDGYEWKEQPVNNYIDSFVHEKLKTLQYLPSQLCSDEEFLRRVYLDLVGVLPTLEEADRFLRDTAKDKRSQLVDDLLERPEHAKYWALKWGDLLRMTKGQVGDEGVYKYHKWVERSIDKNMPYDEFAWQLLTASGSTFNNPPANFYRTANNMNDCVETISQIFLGARLQCAKCHNHPYERWTQDNYYGMGAFFNRILRKKTTRADELVIYATDKGEVTQPRTGEKMKPWVPVVGVLEEVNSADHRATFAEWLTSPDNPFFARIEANRIWSHLLGRGIVDPVDDFRDSNPPSNAPLLEALAKDFAENGFDRKGLVRTIVNSRTYQMSHVPNDFNKDDAKYFSHYRPRLLNAEQMLDAIGHVTGLPESFDSLPPEMKATQLPAPDIADHEFLKLFGQPERATVCDCERTSETNLGMAMQFLNGPLIQGKIHDKNNRLHKWLAAGKTDTEIVNSLHLVALARRSTPNELQAATQHIAAKKLHFEGENARIEKEIDALRASMGAAHDATRENLVARKLESIPESLREDVKKAVAVDKSRRDEVEQYLFDRFGVKVQVTDEEVLEALPAEVKASVEPAQQKIAELQKKLTSSDAMRVVALEDICWVLLNRNEFLFNH